MSARFLICHLGTTATHGHASGGENGYMVDKRPWLDPESAWWAKAARAKYHIDALASDVRRFMAGGTFDVVPERGDEPGETIYRLRMSEPIPARFSTIIGDALHNLRSALDCAACEMARRNVGRGLTEREERACELPVVNQPSKLYAFFSSKQRVRLYNMSDRQAIRAVQPARLHDYLTENGQSPAHDRSEEVAYDHLTILSRLSNIDRHRRLHPVTCGRGDIPVYWGSDGRTQFRWKPGTPPPFKDGSILGHLFADPKRSAPLPKPHHEIALRLLEPQAAGAMDVVSLLESLHGDVTNRVLPRLLGPRPGLHVGEPTYTEPPTRVE